jgi:uncharacterized Rmd1/YagE family protein
MNRYATACQRRQRTQRLRSRAQEKRKHRKREELFKELVSEEAESRQELMARQLKANWNVGRHDFHRLVRVTAYHVLVHEIAR